MSFTARFLNLVRAAQLARAEALAAGGADARAYPLFVRAGVAGLRRAQYRLGRCYLLGLGVPPSLAEALRWLGRAAEAGEADAQTQLAELALQGVAESSDPGLFGSSDLSRAVSAPDFGRAERWCRAAIGAGSVEAMALLGFILTAGPPERRDMEAGEALYRQAAAAGQARGQLGAAITLLRDGTRDGAVQAAALLRSAADGGVAAAHHLLGMLAESGAAGAVDLAAAADYYKEAAEQGHTPAQVRYGFALLHGRGIARDVFTAETWLRRAGLAGEAGAAAVVGYLYARDGDLPPNLAEAAIWLQRAAEAGHVAAARTLGRLLLAGDGFNHDLPEAAHWLLIAAEAGDAVAQFDLGLCLAQGIGIAGDLPGALSWIRLSAEAGHPDARQMLARLGATSADPVGV